MHKYKIILITVATQEDNVANNMLKDSQVSYKPIEKLPESIAEIAGINIEVW